MQILNLVKFDTGATDRPTDRPWPISAMLKNQESCAICLKKWSFFASQKSKKMTHGIERTGMVDIKISN